MATETLIEVKLEFRRDEQGLRLTEPRLALRCEPDCGASEPQEYGLNLGHVIEGK
jgi:hypothetical protein